ncbi:carbohydrate esterase family 16 protein [Mycena latifolia]|nr:carbohydrate esterase family 16 protein [Mycena latifolia]
MIQLWTSLLSLLSVVAAVHLPVECQTNDGVHLAITPVCGKLGGTFANANAGVVTAGIKTLVAFGDSYTSGGRSNGGTLPAAVLNGTSPRAGGRVTDGPVWAEGVASDLGATIKDYAVSGAVINVTLWPSLVGHSDFLHQASLFLSQNNALNPATTLYTVFFGINAHKRQNIVVLDDYGRGSHSTTGDAFKQAVFAGLTPLRAQGLNVAFVDFAPLWDAVLGTTPGFETPGACIPNLSQTDLSGECSTLLNSFYWLPGHPSKETHRIMADYVKLVLANCNA